MTLFNCFSKSAFGLIVAFGLLPLPAAAAAAPELNIATTLASLVLVVTVILFLAWLLKRMKFPGVQSGDASLRILRQLPVGQRERIVLLQVGDEQMLVGVTQQNISLLGKLEQPIAMDEVSGGQDFANQLGKLLKKDDKK
ncbi:flagellar biosynthetic protein FliO [Photobacterium sanctipauli]|uniref:Flagellar protein n=1 Tax=Photobacterium sanctipauli TaxID=1342794 RepID=A0A2T3NTK2_9GAMM|nr:flagellar biosynthetic protein FliO [Photobacterium sanctipauli]PSW19535.1 flagellar biosynthetic protein FliO [Photobacterium sanctipauli]